MPSWNDLLSELEALPSEDEKNEWLTGWLTRSLQDVSALREGRNVVFYASAFLQKPTSTSLPITHEDINGFMSTLYGMDWSKQLTLILHTPGGVTNAAETIVEYLLQKFTDIEVIVPTYAMSAGTMISLAANRIFMGRQSQLGPIDPQMPVGGRFVSARAIVEQFERAEKEIKGDLMRAHVWAPVLQSMGPALLQEAQNALEYSEAMVARWLAARMFAGDPQATDKGRAAAHHFNDASTHKSHGRRIDANEARSHGVAVVDLEADQALQEAVLTAYHVFTIAFEKTPGTKLLGSNHGRTWMKAG
jgi:ClpP class serine protease